MSQVKNISILSIYEKINDYRNVWDFAIITKR